MIWAMMFALLATADTLTPRLPTLKLGRFVIWGLDTLRLHREVVEAYPQVVYTPEPGLPTLPDGFFTPPRDLKLALPPLRVTPSPPWNQGTEGYLLPAFGGISLGTALWIRRPGWSASGWLAGAQWSAEDPATRIQGPWIYGEVHLQHGTQHLEIFGRWNPERTVSTPSFCDLREQDNGGVLQANLQLGLLHLYPWLAVSHLRTKISGVECGTQSQDSLVLSGGMALGIQHALAPTTRVRAWLHGVRGWTPEDLLGEARVGLETWRPSGRWTLELGMGSLKPDHWRPVGRLEFQSPFVGGTRGVALFGRILWPKDWPPQPLHLASPFRFREPFLAPRVLVDRLWQPPEPLVPPTTRPPVAWIGGLALEGHRQSHRWDQWVQVGVMRAEHLWWTSSEGLTGTAAFLRTAGTWPYTRGGVQWSISAHLPVDRSSWPAFLGWVRFSLALTPNTRGMVQARFSDAMWTADLWVQQRIQGALWATAGLWNLTDDPGDATRGRRFFLGLWWHLPTNQGGVP